MIFFSFALSVLSELCIKIYPEESSGIKPDFYYADDARYCYDLRHQYAQGKKHQMTKDCMCVSVCVCVSFYCSIFAFNVVLLFVFQLPDAIWAGSVALLEWCQIHHVILHKAILALPRGFFSIGVYYVVSSPLVHRCQNNSKSDTTLCDNGWEEDICKCCGLEMMLEGVASLVL